MDSWGELWLAEKPRPERSVLVAICVYWQGAGNTWAKQRRCDCYKGSAYFLSDVPPFQILFTQKKGPYWGLHNPPGNYRHYKGVQTTQGGCGAHFQGGWFPPAPFWGLPKGGPQLPGEGANFSFGRRFWNKSRVFVGDKTNSLWRLLLIMGAHSLKLVMGAPIFGNVLGIERRKFFFSGSWENNPTGEII